MDVRITNHARRVAFQFHGDIVGVLGGDGRRLTWSPPAQRALNEATGTDNLLARVAVGDSVTRRLAFEGPAGLGELRVGFFFGGIVGSMLDALLLGRRLVTVPVAR